MHSLKIELQEDAILVRKRLEEKVSERLREVISIVATKAEVSALEGKLDCDKFDELKSMINFKADVTDLHNAVSEVRAMLPQDWVTSGCLEERLGQIGSQISELREEKF